MEKNQIHNLAYMTFTGSIPSRSADAVCVMNMCAALAGHGIPVELVIPGGQASRLADLNFQGTLWDFYGLPENFSMRCLPDPFRRLSGRARKTGFAFLALCYAALSRKHLINARQIELVIMAARFGRPFVYECHNFLKPAGSRLFPRFIALMNDPQCRGAIVTTTRAGRDSFVKAGVPGSRIAVLPNGVNVHRHESLPPADEIRRSLQLPCSQTIACFSGSLYPGRGIENIIHCAEHFRDVCFLLVGGSPDEVCRYRAMADSKASTNLHFTGYVPSTAIPAYLKAADILLMPNTSASSGHSIAYTSPMKTFDYLAAGKPIIASDFPVLREVLVHEHNAFLVPPDSREALVRGLQWVIDNPAAARAIAAQACIDSKKYSWQKRAEDYLSFVRAVL